MSNQDYNYDSDSDRVSIHSIVSENVQFESDNEAPEDKCAQVDKIIKNHVIKEIIVPGKGLSKPSKFDYVTLKYKCYFQSLNHFKNEKEFYTLIDKTDAEYKEYLHRLKFPEGIVKAIPFMRAGEKARIILRPKYGFKKIKEESIEKYFAGDLEAIIKHYKAKNTNYSRDELIKDLKSKTLIYEMNLVDFTKIYDISGMQNMMKQILVQGEGLVKPFENNLVSINYKIYLNNKLFKEKSDHTDYLNSDNFTEGEITILKSMKKNELNRIDILFDYFLEDFVAKSNLFSKSEFDSFIEKLKSKNINSQGHNHKENSNMIENNDETGNEFNLAADKIETYFSENEEKIYQSKSSNSDEYPRLRVTYEFELVKLKNNKSFNSFKNITYEKTTLCKGVGNICPWDRSLIKFLMKLKINETEIYCDEFRELKISEIEFTKRIKDLKKIIKTKKDYLKNIQFLIDNLIQENKLTDSEIYDPLMLNLPDLIYETLKTMRILQVENLNFTLGGAKAKQELLKLNFNSSNNNNINNKNIIEIDFAANEEFKNKDITFNVTLCLLNFQENFSIFNKNVILWDEDTKMRKLLEYKSEANFYFAKAHLNKAKKINKFLVTEYTKSINVDKSNSTSDLLVRNKDDFVKPELKFDFLSKKGNELINTDTSGVGLERKFYFEMKKVFSNLILIYFKIEKLKKCQEYIDLFLHIFAHEMIIDIENKSEKNEKRAFIVDEIYEKVLFLEFKLKMKLCEFSQSEAIIKLIIGYYHVEMDLNKPLVFDQADGFENKDNIIIRFNNYLKEYEQLKEKIRITENNKTSMFKKMFKY